MFAGVMTHEDRAQIAKVVLDEQQRAGLSCCHWCGKTFTTTNPGALPQNQICTPCRTADAEEETYNWDYPYHN